MKTMQWVQFNWDLSDLPPVPVALKYELRVTGMDDCEPVKDVITKAIALDSTWNFGLEEVEEMLRACLGKIADRESVSCISLRHGTRIIGGTFIVTDENLNEQLVPGPCVLMEYRNRGLATLLLHAALGQLRDRDVSRAAAMTSEASIAARFLYRKFGGKCSPCSPLLAA